MVYYACPMIFDKSVLYEVDVTLDTLQLVEMASCPGSFSDNSKHYIYFNQKNAQPVWCSDPVEGKSVKAQHFAERVVTHLRQLEPTQSAEKLEAVLATVKSLKAEEVVENKTELGGLSFFADALTIVQVVQPPDGAA
ncbi:hypothetical protein [uncultured Lamprocystis sp.]|jgi:hypothetical protein|uniref:hypothetical protein n=1 Tax=uncultured Lamprocystis sp. TaxID=543132 RepID=UPI0025D169E6|nr:hypothetical protein [uncultured Lamprocystis sp.]